MQTIVSAVGYSDAGLVTCLSFKIGVDGSENTGLLQKLVYFKVL